MGVVRKLGAVVTVVLTLIFTACASSTAATSTASSSAIPATDVLNLEMFNPHSGVAVVFSPLPPECTRNCTAGVPNRFRDYLAVTSDGGETWRTTGRLPATFNPGATYALQLAFRNPREGYVQSTDPAETLFTDDAGRTWSKLHTQGWATALSLAGPSLWIVSEFCSPPLLPPDGLCPSRLLTYLLGHLTPVSETPIPTKGILASQGISSGSRAATLFDRLGPDFSRRRGRIRRIPLQSLAHRRHRQALEGPPQPVRGSHPDRPRGPQRDPLGPVLRTGRRHGTWPDPSLRHE